MEARCFGFVAGAGAGVVPFRIGATALTQLPDISFPSLSCVSHTITVMYIGFASSAARILSPVGSTRAFMSAPPQLASMAASLRLAFYAFLASSENT